METFLDDMGPNEHSLGNKSVPDVWETPIGAVILEKGLDGAVEISPTPTNEHYAQQKFRNSYTSLFDYKGNEKPNYPVQQKMADVCEAPIGAAFPDNEPDGAANMVSPTSTSERHAQQAFGDDYISLVDYKGDKEPAESAIQQKLADDIDAQFGYKFKDLGLLMSVFTHSTNSSKEVPSYQKLTSLSYGDSLLGMACAAFLFKAHPEADPGQLTEYKKLMISKKFRGALSVILGFDKRVCVGDPHLGPSIDKYSKSIFLARQASDKLNFWINPSIMSPPKILPEVLDAFISAIYFDSDYNYGLVEGFFNSYVLPHFMDMSLYDDFLFSPEPHVLFARKLAKIGCQQWAWERGTDRTKDRPKHLEAILIHGVVFTSCSTRNVNLARKRVAVAALEKLESLSPVELRRLCNCPKSHQDGEHAEAEARRKRIKIEE